MKPIVLIKLPNSNFFFGSEDVDKLQAWWKSYPLPGDVEEILDSIWAYGQYHICWARMADGTYSIFQSRNYGVQWVEVFNTTEEIKTISRLDFGWLLASTSGGWYESIDSGSTWIQVSTQAPGCFLVREVKEGVLLAMDGAWVWRSTDYARSWTHSIAAATKYPNLDGRLGRVFLGIGKTIHFSDTAGASWLVGDVYGVDPWNITHRRESGAKDETITAIIVTGTTGSSPGEIIWLIQALNTKTKIYRHYYYTEGAKISGWAGAKFQARFDANYDPEAYIDSQEILPVGTSSIDRIVTFTGTKFDTAQNKWVTRVTVSPDGGWTWVDRDLTTADVYSGPDLSQLSFEGGNPFIVEYTAQWHWTGSVCHNTGKWVLDNSMMRRGLSWEMDLKYREHIDHPLRSITRLVLVNDRKIDVDHLLRKEFNKNLPSDALLLATVPKPLWADSVIKKAFDAVPDLSTVLVIRNTIPLLHDSFFRKAMDHTFCSQAYVRGEVNGGYGMGIVLTRSKFNELLIKIERFFPQIYDIRAPMLQYSVYDSRRDGRPSDLGV